MVSTLDCIVCLPLASSFSLERSQWILTSHIYLKGGVWDICWLNSLLCHFSGCSIIRWEMLVLPRSWEGRSGIILLTSQSSFQSLFNHTHKLYSVEAHATNLLLFPVLSTICEPRYFFIHWTISSLYVFLLFTWRPAILLYKLSSHTYIHPKHPGYSVPWFARAFLHLRPYSFHHLERSPINV